MFLRSVPLFSALVLLVAGCLDDSASRSRIEGDYTVTFSNGECSGTMTLLAREDGTLDGMRTCTNDLRSGRVEGTMSGDQVVLDFYYGDHAAPSTMTGSFDGETIAGDGVNPNMTDSEYHFIATRIAGPTGDEDGGPTYSVQSGVYVLSDVTMLANSCVPPDYDPSGEELAIEVEGSTFAISESLFTGSIDGNDMTGLLELDYEESSCTVHFRSAFDGELIANDVLDSLFDMDLELVSGSAAECAEALGLENIPCSLTYTGTLTRTGPIPAG